MSVLPVGQNPLACVFCKTDDDDISKYGGIKSTKNIKVHYFCLLLSTNIKQSGRDNSGILGFLYSDIKDELERTEHIHCCYCKKPHATIYCAAKRCKRVFHLPCGKENRTSHDFLYHYKSYCHIHRQVQRISSSLKRSFCDLSCLICCENFTKNDQENVFWPGCCEPQALLHRICVQRYTISAGYYTKCPTCNEVSGFIRCCKEYGIFVPMQDASWELDPDAFVELSMPITYDCSSEVCLSPYGRAFNEAHTTWQMVICSTCGAFASHRGCLETAGFSYHAQYICAVCLNVCKKFETQPRSNAKWYDGFQSLEDRLNDATIITVRRRNTIPSVQDLPTTSQETVTLLGSRNVAENSDSVLPEESACSYNDLDKSAACSNSSTHCDANSDGSSCTISVSSTHTAEPSLAESTSTYLDEIRENISPNKESVGTSVEENNNGQSVTNASANKRGTENTELPSNKIRKSHH